MKICLVATFPPSGRQLNEYAFHIAKELNSNPDVELTILGDELTSYDFATDENGQPLKVDPKAELPGFNVIRCWRFGPLSTPWRLVNTIRKLKPDVVWFNLVFSSFATPENPFAAFAGLSAPALVRAAGFYTHITLHHIIEHVDFAAAGVRLERLYRVGTDVATRALLRANSVSVLLPGYRRTLVTKYAAQNVLLGTHGTFASTPAPPDFTKRGNPHQRILAIGHWGTYKRLETLMEAFPLVLEKVPNAKLVVAGANHHTRAATGNPSAMPKTLACQSNFAAMSRKTKFRSCSNPRRSWFCLTTRQRVPVALPIRRVNMASQSSAQILTISAVWQLTKEWPCVFTTWAMPIISQNNSSGYCDPPHCSNKWQPRTFLLAFK